LEFQIAIYKIRSLHPVFESNGSKPNNGSIFKKCRHCQSIGPFKNSDVTVRTHPVITDWRAPLKPTLHSRLFCILLPGRDQFCDRHDGYGSFNWYGRLRRSP